MKLNKKKAYSLSELLVVVMVVGVLSAVAVPKMKQAVETRRTTEAENMISAVRTEQEQRCVFGKEYQTTTAKVDVLADATKSANYTYSLQSTGVAATAKSGKDYTIKMKSYKTGQLCCEGSYCANLNKSYPLCDSVSIPVDECAGDTSCSADPDQPKCCNPSEEKWDGSKCVELTPCEKTPNSCACSTFASANYEKCSPDSCTNNPNQAKCCVGNEIWEGGKCIDYCATAPNTCKCKTYALTHYEECSEDSCTNNPNQQKCCTSSQEWNGSKCVDLCTLYAGTCKCPDYASSHYEECDANSCTNNPNQEKCCDISTQKWDGSKCVALTACEINPNSCSCQTYYDSHVEECDANSCTNRPNQAKCCDPNTQVWDGEEGQCVPKPACPGEQPEAETIDCRFGCGTQQVEYECNATASAWVPVYGECSTKSGYSEECTPATTRSQSCNNVGTQIKTCTEKCSWGDWGECDCGEPPQGQTYNVQCPYGYSGQITYTWNTKTCTYDENNACVKDDCPHEEEPSPTTRDCNYGCGTQSVTYTCNKGTAQWEPVYGECGPKSGYKLECTPGTSSSQACNSVGTQMRECNNKCTWGDWDDCDCGTPPQGNSYTESCAYGHTGIKTYTWNTSSCKYDLKDTCVKDDCPHEARPADTTEACGNCGTRSVTYVCNTGSGQWEPSYGSCTGQGECAPGAKSTAACSGNGSKSRTCSSKCTWGSWGSCECGEPPYGDPYIEACSTGYTGNKTYTWNNSSCAYDVSNGCAACECTAGTTQSQTCKNYGTQTRTCKSDGTCSWGSWSTCSCPASVAPNGASYTASCPADHTGSITYTWNTSTCSYDVNNTCVAEACPSSQRPSDYTESCGNCGTREVTYYCNTSAKQWMASYGTCNGQGTCSPGATSTSTSGCSGNAQKSRTCNSSCQWGSYGSCKCTSTGSDYSVSCGSGYSGSIDYDWNSTTCQHDTTNNCSACECSGSETETQYTGVGSAYKTRTCNGCYWGAWSSAKCASTGSCSNKSCGSGQTGTITGSWNSSPSVCACEYTNNCKTCECSGSQTETQYTGVGSAYKTRTCDGCNWGSWKTKCDSKSNYTENCASGYYGNGYTYTWNNSTSVCDYVLSSSNCNKCTCTPGATQSQSCKTNGTQTRTCKDSCTGWGDWSTCSCPNGPDGNTKTLSCGSGYVGSINQKWDTSSCSYVTTSDSCEPEGPCKGTKPEDYTSGSCNCGTLWVRYYCNEAAGEWRSSGSCELPSGYSNECVPGKTQEQTCQTYGKQTRTCSSKCAWGSWGTCQICKPTNNGQESYSVSCASGYSGSKTYTWDYANCKYTLKDTCACTPTHNGQTTYTESGCTGGKVGVIVYTWNNSTCSYTRTENCSCPNGTRADGTCKQAVTKTTYTMTNTGTAPVPACSTSSCSSLSYTECQNFRLNNGSTITSVAGGVFCGECNANRYNYSCISSFYTSTSGSTRYCNYVVSRCDKKTTTTWE